MSKFHHITINGKPKCQHPDPVEMPYSPCAHASVESLAEYAGKLRAALPDAEIAVVAGDCPFADRGAW